MSLLFPAEPEPELFWSPPALRSLRRAMTSARCRFGRRRFQRPSKPGSKRCRLNAIPIAFLWQVPSNESLSLQQPLSFESLTNKKGCFFASFAF